MVRNNNTGIIMIGVITAAVAGLLFFFKKKKDSEPAPLKVAGESLTYSDVQSTGTDLSTVPIGQVQDESTEKGGRRGSEGAPDVTIIDPNRVMDRIRGVNEGNNIINNAAGRGVNGGRRSPIVNTVITPPNTSNSPNISTVRPSTNNSQPTYEVNINDYARGVRGSVSGSNSGSSSGSRRNSTPVTPDLATPVPSTPIVQPLPAHIQPPKGKTVISANTDIGVMKQSINNAKTVTLKKGSKVLRVMV